MSQGVFEEAFVSKPIVEYPLNGINGSFHVVKGSGGVGGGSRNSRKVRAKKRKMKAEFE